MRKRPVHNRLSSCGILHITPGSRHSSMRANLECSCIDYGAVVGERGYPNATDLKRARVHQATLIGESSRIDQRVACIREGAGVDG